MNAQKLSLQMLIADDHAVVRKGLRQILAEEFPQAGFRETAAIPETLAAVRAQRWDLLLLDLFMPGGDGLEVLHEVRRKQPRLPVLVLSSGPEEQLGLRVLRAGADGFLNKQAAPEHLLVAVQQVLAGHRYLSTPLAQQFVVSASRDDQPLHEKLSEREFQVLRLLVGGRHIEDIAGDLSLSVKSVRTYRVRLLEKLELQSDVGLVHYALDNRLVEKAAPLRSLRD